MPSHLRIRRPTLAAAIGVLAFVAWGYSQVNPGSRGVLWIWCGLVAALFVVGIRGWIKRQRAHPPGCCQKCGYDRKGLAKSALCPECGVNTPTDANSNT